MTRVYLEQDGRRFLVSCQGHATGSTEMCAAISCLVQTLDGWLDQEECAVTERKVEPGTAVLRFSGGARCKAVFDLLVTGFFCLAATDQQHISVVFQEV